MIKKIWRQLNLNQRIVFPFLAVSLSILMVSVLALGYWITQGLEQNIQSEVEIFAERVQQDFRYKWQELSDQLVLISAQDSLRQAIERQDQILLSQILLPLKASLGFDWVEVVDTQGTVLLDARRNSLSSANLSNTAIRLSASAGANLTDLILVENLAQPQVLLVANHSIKTNHLLGGLIVGQLVNNALLQKIATGSSKQLVALVNNQIIAKTLPDVQMLTVVPLDTQTAILRIEAGGQHYFAKPVLLNGSNSSFSILVLHSIDSLKAAKTLLWWRLGLLLLLSSAIVTSIGIGVSRAIANPIRILTHMTQQLAQGNLAVRISTTSKDEVGQLGKAFNQMAEQLIERGLLSQKIQQLQKTLGDLEKNQAQLIHAEKMSSLGQLVAGVAHEINTPLGAIQSSIGNITGALEQALRELPPLLQTLPPEQLSNFFTLLDWTRQPQTMLSSREERQLRRNIKQNLAEQGLLHTDRLADTLSKMGITTALTPILPLLQATDAPMILDTAYQLSIVQNNSQNIQLAVDRASRIVYTLKNYVRQDVLGAPIYAAVTEGIDTVLTLYQSQIKSGVEVEKRYTLLPHLLCYPEELIQVWSNLISNAIQAMNYQGKLTIATFEQNQHVVVQIMDTGSGIPPHIQAQIFEPFFTTKAMGEGTGLGLSIVKNIIDKHEGRIEVESTSGHTIFKVWLPLNIS
jgi:signal transduction histidine kinase